jgi:diadenylate cyclase
LRTLFVPHGPLHDGAVILRGERVVAAGCQLPLAQPNPDLPRVGMRHRAALGLSDETDAVLVVVSEETGRISLAVGGKLEPVPREHLAGRLGELLGRAA